MLDLIQVNDGDSDVITVPSGQIHRQTQHLGETIWSYRSIPVVAKGVADQVGGDILVLKRRQDPPPPLQQEALQVAQRCALAGNYRSLLLEGCATTNHTESGR